MIERKPRQPKPKTEAALRIGQQRYPIFRKYVPLEGKIPQGALRKVCEETGLGSRQAGRLAKKFRANPVPDSLAPGRTGPKLGSHRAPDQVQNAIDALVSELYLNKTPPAKALAADQVYNLLIAKNGDFKLDPIDVPSKRVIERMIEEITEPTKARSSKGSKSRTASEPHPGHYDSAGFLDLAQMDSTRADVALVDRTLREPLDRPWITFIIEVWTRCILGFYFTFGDPSIYRCGQAVVNAILPKQAMLMELDLDVDYPMHGTVARLHADQAKPHRSTAFRSACLSVGMDPDVREPGPAHHGGHIERLIGTFVGKLRLLPGATGSNVTQRDGYDPFAAAVMTLPEFERWMILQIAAYHNTPHDGLDGISPAHAWAKATRGKNVLLPVGLDQDRLRKRFLPMAEVQVHSFGVVVKTRKYHHPKLAKMIGLKVNVRIDERNLNEVYMEWEEDFLTLSSTRIYPDVTEQEWEAARARRRKEEGAFQTRGAQQATAQYVHDARQETLKARKLTREVRNSRKRMEEGRKLQASEEPSVERTDIWVDLKDLGESGWELHNS